MSGVIVGALSDLADGEVVRCDVGGRSVAVIRIGDDVYALEDRCTHADVPLSSGDVYVDTMEIECFKHGSAFSLLTGEPACPPATKPVQVYAASVVDGQIVIDVEATGAA